MRLFLLAILMFAQVNAGQVVLITGAARGIGYSIAEELKEDFTVYAGVRKHSLDKKFPEGFHIVELDVTDQESIDKAIKLIMEKEGKIDVLVNNAGVEICGSIENVTIEEAKRLFDVNFFGVMRVSQAVLPIMRGQNHGRIIQISSRSGFRPLLSLSIYAASKFALEGVSETMAALGRPWNIFVSLIEPGPVDTDLDYEAPYGSHLPADQDPYLEVFSKAGLLDPYNPLAQDPHEIALIVKEAINAEKPHFRYQTAQYIEEQAALRFVDITGDACVDSWKTILE